MRYIAAMVAAAALLWSCESTPDTTPATEAATPAMESTMSTAAVGEMAPDFTLTSAAGASHSLSDFEGKWVVLEWVNYDCPFVRKHYDSGNMQTLQKDATANGVVWLTICSSAPGKQGHFEGDALQSRIAKEGGNQTAYLIDADGSVGRAYQATATPHMYLIDPMGKLLYAGAIDDKPSTKVADIATATNYVSAAMSAAMQGEPVAVSSTKAYGCAVKY